MSDSRTPPPVVRSATVACGPDEAFRIFTDEIGAWWPLPTHGVFGADGGGVVFRDGRLVELACDGREAVWGEVEEWEPPHRLAIAWHPGRTADEASLVEVTFVSVDDGTQVVIEHHGWETFGADAAARRRGYVGPNAWGYVLDHYADGATAQVEPAELGALADAYEAFFAEYEVGGFGPAAPGEWDADRVLAHVALNDAAMLAVGHALVHGAERRFENVVSQDPGVLTSWVESAGGPGEMLARARQAAGQFVAGLARLSSDQLATPVSCRLLHDGEVAFEDARPWAEVAIGIQSAGHLPAHTQQLRDLRP